MITFERMGFVFDIILVFIFFYAIVFVGIPFASSKFVLLFLVLVCGRKYIANDLIKNKFIRYCFFVWVTFSLYYFAVTTFKGVFNFGFLQQTFWFFVEGVFFSYLLFHYLTRKYSRSKIMMLLVNVFFVQSLFVILCFISTSLREFIDSILVINDPRYISSTRLKGLANSGGAGLSYLQAIGVFAACSLILEEKSKRRVLFLLVSIAIISISQIFIARTGLLFSILFIIGTIVQYSINNGSIVKLLKQSIGILASLLLIANSYLFFIPSDKIDSFNERIIGRAFEFYQNYERTGQFETNSTTALQNMYIFPESDLEVIFGAGIWDDPPGTRKFYKRQVNSDVGYIRLIYAAGLIGSLLFYSIYYYYLKNLSRSDFSNFFKIGITCILVVFVIGELKEPFLVRSSGIIKSLCLILFIYTIRPIKNQSDVHVNK